MDIGKIIKSSFEIVKKNKEAFFIALVLVLFVVQHFWSKSQIESASSESQALMQQTNRDFEEIREVYNSQMQKQQQINEQQQAEITRLSTEYAERIQALEARTRTRRATFVRETEGNPDEMASRLTKRLGWSSQ